MSSNHKELTKPGTIQHDAFAQEMVRFWISNNQDHVSLLVGGSGDPEKEPAMWGFILGDIAKHVTDAFKDHHPDGPEKEEIIKEIVTGFLNRIQFGPKSPGDVQKMGD